MRVSNGSNMASPQARQAVHIYIHHNHRYHQPRNRSQAYFHVASRLGRPHTTLLRATVQIGYDMKSKHLPEIETFAIHHLTLHD